MLGHEGEVPGTRELTPHSSYRLVYEIHGGTIWVLTIIIGDMANQAKAKQVVLTHFVPSPETVTDQTIYRREIALSYKGPVSLANDLYRF